MLAWIEMASRDIPAKKIDSLEKIMKIRLVTATAGI
jgi:hypothetical protein